MEEEEAANLVNEAAKYAIRHDGLSIRQCLVLAGFSKEDAKGRRLQMRVARRPALVAARKKQKEGEGRTRSADYVTPESSTPQFPPPETPPSRVSSKKSQQNRTHQKLLRRHKSAAFKRATVLFAEQEEKDADEQLSAEKVRHIVDSEYGEGMSPTVRLIQRNVKAGIIGVSPVKPGKKSDLHDFTFKALVGAVETFTVISQINGQSSRTTARFLSVKINREALREAPLNAR